MKQCYFTDQVIAKNVNKGVEEWKSAGDILKYLKPLKHDRSDSAMPSKRCDLLKKYKLWKTRSRRMLVPDQEVQRQFEEWVQSRTQKS